MTSPLHPYHRNSKDYERLPEMSEAAIYAVMTRMRAASLGCLKIYLINSLKTFQISFRLSDRVFYPKAHFSIQEKKMSEL